MRGRGQEKGKQGREKKRKERGWNGVGGKTGKRRENLVAYNHKVKVEG
jgi:hypothetical protein